MKADHTKVNRLLNTAKGQIEGIIKMVDDDRYCMDIVNQLLAVEAILRKTNKEVLAAHMKCCINEATMNHDEDKIDEMIKLLDHLIK